MYVEDSIKLSREDFVLLIEDTDRHRICWAYHDILSDPKIALLFARLAREEIGDRENQTVMTWVAHCQQENSYYLLFKWYKNFYDPPENIDLYVLHRRGSDTGGLVVQPVQMTFASRLSEKGRTWYRNLWGKVSENVSWFFGEADFEGDGLLHFFQYVLSCRGKEQETFERRYEDRSDGELSVQCRAVEAYFRSIQAVDEVIHATIEEMGRDKPKPDLLRTLRGILERISTMVDLSRMDEYAIGFSRMSDNFFRQPVYAPALDKSSGRQFKSLTERKEIFWMNLREWQGHDVLRALYFQCNPRAAWDVFQPWRGEVYFTVLRRSAGRELHRGVYLLTRFIDQRGRYMTDLFWLENTSACVAHLCSGEFLPDLLDTLRNSYVRQADLPQTDESMTVERIYRQLKSVYYEVGEKRWRRL